MEHEIAVRALAALAHGTRLAVHRLLVQAGADGLSAGFIAEHLDLPASSLSFHLAHLQTAGLVRQRRAGRSLIYAVDYSQAEALVDYLQENCCDGIVGEGSGCAPDCAPSDVVEKTGRSKEQNR